ncbi:MAG: DUF695 domain-containing protein [Roseivirga sp.]|nr:DUF695 domain-containing protein [Roseivirga sp.]
MSFFKSLFGKKQVVEKRENPIWTNEDFWRWFEENEQGFHNAINEHKNIERDFFDHLSPNLNKLRKDCFYFLSGMSDDTTAELILTAEGNIRNIAFLEALVATAPELPNWKFTLLKPSMDIENTNIQMEGYVFNKDTLSFYANEHPETPDEIDISIVHRDFEEKNRATLTNGTYIFLDNFLGELEFATTIDRLDVIGHEEATGELIPIEKLKAFLIWREKEFVEKYDGLRYNTEDDSYSSLEAKTQEGDPMLATVNLTLLDWDRKASHPWVCVLQIKYDGRENNGLPSGEVYELLNEIEDELTDNHLKDQNGYLNIGRQTVQGTREVYFACKDFRKPSIVLDKLSKDHDPRIAVSYDIFKDKYWQTFNKFLV